MADLSKFRVLHRLSSQLWFERWFHAGWTVIKKWLPNWCWTSKPWELFWLHHIEVLFSERLLLPVYVAGLVLSNLLELGDYCWRKAAVTTVRVKIGIGLCHLEILDGSRQALKNTELTNQWYWCWLVVPTKWWSTCCLYRRSICWRWYRWKLWSFRVAGIQIVMTWLSTLQENRHRQEGWRLLCYRRYHLWIIRCQVLLGVTDVPRLSWNCRHYRLVVLRTVKQLVLQLI